jgi:hypothetical protein
MDSCCTQLPALLAQSPFKGCCLVPFDFFEYSVGAVGKERVDPSATELMLHMLLTCLFGVICCAILPPHSFHAVHQRCDHLHDCRLSISAGGTAASRAA